MTRYLVFSGLLILCACSSPTFSTPARINTPSGKPEITVTGHEFEEVFDACVVYAGSRGWEVEVRGSHQVIGWLEAGGPAFLLGSQYDPIVWIRVTITVGRLGKGRGVKVFGRQDVIANRGGAFQKIYPKDDLEALKKTQGVLLAISNRLSGGVSEESQIDLTEQTHKPRRVPKRY